MPGFSRGRRRTSPSARPRWRRSRSRQWPCAIGSPQSTAWRMNLLAPAAPHLTLQAKDADNRAYLVEILTWRDGSIPDHAPADIQAIWKEMNALVEPRSGRPGLDIVEVVPVTRGK